MNDEMAVKNFDTVIVGAGPAGLSAALALSENCTKEILLIDRGRGLNSRSCPVDAGLNCNACGGTCNVISGFGGCMQVGDAMKFSLAPSGHRLQKLLGLQKSQDLYFEAIQKIIEFSKKDTLKFHWHIEPEVNKRFIDEDLSIKDYPVFSLSESEIKFFLESIYSYLQKRINISLENKVCDIQKSKDVYIISTEHGEIFATNVILSMGRAGVSSLEDTLHRLGIETQAPEPSLGVRFEFNSHSASWLNKIHPDLKISLTHENGLKTKTFCLSNGSNGGRIKFCNYQDQFSKAITLLDGHIVEEKDKFLDLSRSGNIAILVQMPKQIGNIASWSKDLFINKYSELMNGKPCVQLFNHFEKGISTDSNFCEVQKKIDFQPSVNDLKVAPLYQLFSPAIREAICTQFRKIIKLSAQTAGEELHQDFWNNIIVMGPEFELFWNTIALDQNCETELPGLFVTGDSNGKAQGALQAMVTGLAAGKAVLSRQKEMSSIR